MKKFFIIFVGCLISTLAFAGGKKVDGASQTSLIRVEIEPGQELRGCEPENDAWRCEPPQIASEPRIIEWEEEGNEVILELGLTNF